jgi:MoaA/NifB/PqqE/SkfB family radical SAM enzyme
MTEFGWDQLDSGDKALILKGMKTGKTFLGPRTVQVQWTDRCNLHGRSHSRESLHFEDEMDLFTLERLFAQMGAMGVRTLMVNGGGEPLYHRHADVILRELGRAPFRIGTLSTNGVLLKPELHPLLCRAVRHRISVSLNLFGPRAYAEWMGVPEAVYDRVLDNVRGFLDYRRSHGDSTPSLALQFLVHGGNFRDMPRMLELARSLGAGAVSFNPLPGGESLARLPHERQREFLAAAAEVFRSDDAGMVDVFQTGDPRLDDQVRRLREGAFPGKYAHAERRSAAFGAFRTACVMPWFGMLVRADGYVHPCTCLAPPAMRPMGNIFASPLASIWKDGPCRALRRRMGKFLEAVQGGDEALIARLPLPESCKTRGGCFGKGRPYLEDAVFCQELDSWLRGGERPDIEFPDRLRDAEWSLIRGRWGMPWPWKRPAGPQVRIDGRTIGATVQTLGGFSFGFLPDFLSKGFHLLEVMDGNGRLLKARIVEKIA